MNLINKTLQLLAALLVKLFYSSLVTRKENKKHIALIRPDAIGDFLIFLQYAHNLRDKYPKSEYHITLFSHPLHQILSEKFLDFDQFIPMEPVNLRTKILSLFQFMQQNHCIHYLEVIMCPYSRDWVSDCFLFSLSSGIKTGWNGDNANINPYLKKLSNLFYNNLRIPTLEQIKEPNEYLFNQLILDQKRVTLDQNKNNFISVFIGASWDGRIWPLQKFAEVLDYLCLKESEVLLLGGPNDLNRSHSILKQMKHTGKINNLVGKTTLSDLVSKIGESKLLITTESSAMHAASLTNTKCIVIMGGGHFNRFKPDSNKCHIVNYFMDCYFCNWDCPYYNQGHPVPCIEQIKTETVISEINKYASV